MALDAAEKMFCKIVLKNNLLKEDELNQHVNQLGEHPTESLPHYLKKQGVLKPDIIKKIVAAIEDKGQIFTKALLNNESEEGDEPEPSLPQQNVDPAPLKAPSSQATPSSSIPKPSSPAPLPLEDDEFTLELPSVDAETVTNPIIIGQKVTLKPSEEGGGESPEVVYENDDDGLLPNPIVKAQGLGEQLIKYLQYAREHQGSDFHLSVDSPPLIRRYGGIVKLGQKNITEGQSEKMIFGVLTERQKSILNQNLNLDFTLATEDGQRYRANIIRQRNGWDATFRIIPENTPHFSDLGLPPIVKRLTEYGQGLVLVTGPKGCGKTTTLAAMIDLINQNRKDHVITVEDPIEYLHPSVNCQMTQRSLGVHTMSYGNALRGALREDPDIIMVGELRDLETISACITAAETGHLVLASIHTTSAIRTVDRIIDSFPARQQAQIRVMIAESIRGIICQQLLPRKDGKGYALALEILLNNTSVRKHIIDAKTFQLDSIMQISVKEGMVRMDDSIKKLYDQSIITAEVAKEYAREPEKLGV